MTEQEEEKPRALVARAHALLLQDTMLAGQQRHQPQQQREEPEEPEALLRRAIAAGASGARAHYLLATCERKRGATRRAVTRLEAAAIRAPHAPCIPYGLALAREAEHGGGGGGSTAWLEDADRAVVLAKKAGNPSICLSVARLLKRHKKQRPRELAAVQAAVALCESSNTLGSAAAALRIKARMALASVLRRCGHLARARDTYASLLAMDAAILATALPPGKEETLRHWFAACGGVDVTSGGSGEQRTAPPSFVTNLYDDYAHKFDEHLVTKLQYRTPELVADALVSVVPACGFTRVADLGCGTGLAVASLRATARQTRLLSEGVKVSGVDLSPNMIAKAREKRLYNGELIVGPLDALLEGRPEGSWDLVVCCDVFPYVGDLRPVFAATLRALSRGGCFAFSAELPSPVATTQETMTAPGGAGFALAPTGRFWHAASYLRGLAVAVGYEVMSLTARVLRRNAGKDVLGSVVVLRRPTVL